MAEQTKPNRTCRNPSKKGGSPGRTHCKRSVFRYLTILFAAAFLMLLLAYFIQQRNSEVLIDPAVRSADYRHLYFSSQEFSAQSLPSLQAALQNILPDYNR